MEIFEELKKIMGLLEEDLKKFYEKQNNAASIRARKNLQIVKALAQQIRADISKTKNAN